MKKSKKDRIETERLVLRKVAYRDVFAIKKEFDFELTRFMTPAPAKNLREEFRVVRGMRALWKKGIDCVYAVTKKETGEFLGLCGLHGLNRELPSFGIWIKRSAHGNAYGKEAVYGAAAFAKRLGFREATYPVDRRNGKSKRIPLEMGGTLETSENSVSDTGRALEIEIYRIDLTKTDF